MTLSQTVSDLATAVRTVTMSDLPALVGTRLGTSSLHDITQQRIETFADATDDHQWIHTDPVAAAQGPFGGTIAHGYLTLSLGSALLWEVLDVTDAVEVLNYGLDKVRFPSPVASGSQIALTVDLIGAGEIPGGLDVRMRWTFAVPGEPKPACVAEAIFRYYGELTA